MHLGHPEYNAGRILEEMERDKARGDVPPPENFDPDQAQTLWRSHRNLLFQQWVWFCYQRVSLNAWRTHIAALKARGLCSQMGGIEWLV